MPRPSRVDLTLYHVTDAPLSATRGLIETVLMAVRGGATLIQLRDPQAKSGALVEQGRALIAALQPFGVPLIINDRPDIAKAIGAAGVHVGQQDMPAREVRALMGPDAIIGLSIDHPDQMADVPWGVVDHLGVGPVISKGVKPDAAEPMGLKGLSWCAMHTRAPIVAIGGIGPGHARECILAGADGVAVVAAIAGANDPETAARNLRAETEAALAERRAEARAG